MALKGDTSNLQLADIFQTLSQGGQCGLLTLRTGTVERRVLFSPLGVTVPDASAFRAQRLAHLLVAGGLATEEEIEPALAELDRDGPNPFSSVAMLVILEEAGVLQLQDGVAVLRTEVREELFEVFRLPEMEFEFLDDETPVEGIPRECYFRVEEIVLEAARRLDEWRRMDGRVDPAEYYVLVDRPERGDDPTLCLLDGTHTIQDIAEKLLRPRFEVARTAFALLEEGRIRKSSADELIRAARALDPQSQSRRVTRLCERALLRIDAADPRMDDVADLLVQARATHPAVTALTARARALLEQGSPETAYAQVVRARDLDPNDVRVQQVLAELHRARGESASEVKVLTTLAERSAAEGRFSDAVDYAARVAELQPDSPLLDRSFVLYCQKAERNEFGAEVLSVAAGKRGNPTRAALLLNGILLLDPSRTDIKKALARQQKSKNRTRWMALAGAAMLVPAAIVGAHLAGGEIDEARLVGRVDSLEALLEGGQAKIARPQLQAALDQARDEELSSRIRMLIARADQALEAERRREAETRERALSEQLAEIQTAIDAREYDRAFSSAGRTLERFPEAEEKIRTWVTLLADAAEREFAAMGRDARELRVPSEDGKLESVLKRYTPRFNADRRHVWTGLRDATGSELEDRWADLRKRLHAAAAGAVDLLDANLETLKEIERRLQRTRELDRLSTDYEEIEQLVERADFRAARDRYARLLEDYGDGPLTSYFEERLERMRALAELLDRIDAELARGNAAEANRAVRAAAAESDDPDLLATLGVPVRIETLPRGATLVRDGRPLGPAPQNIFVRSNDVTVLRATAPGFADREVSLDTGAEPVLRLVLARRSRFTVELDARVDCDPVAVGKTAFAGGRDGGVYRIDLDGGDVARFDTGSLGGVTCAPVALPDGVLVVTAEGDAIRIDRDSMTQRFRVALEGAPLPRIAVDGRNAYIALRDGRVFECSLATGKTRAIARVDAALVAGIVAVGPVLVVGDSSGRVIGLRSGDGVEVFRTPKSAQPVASLAADADRVYAMFDSGTLVAIEPSGREAWRAESAEAFAAGPIARDGLVVCATGRTARAFDAETGARRIEASIESWISAPPVLSAGRLYVAGRDGTVTAFDVQTTEPLFRHPTDGALHGAPLPVPEGVLLVSAEGTAELIGS